MLQLKTRIFFRFFLLGENGGGISPSFSVFVETRSPVVRQHEGDKEPAVALRVDDGDAHGETLYLDVDVDGLHRGARLGDVEAESQRGMGTRRELALAEAFGEGRAPEDVDALLEGLLLHRLHIATRAVGDVGDHIVVIGLEPGQRCTKFVGPARLDAAPIGLAEDASLLAIAEAGHVDVVQLAVDEGSHVDGGDVQGLDFLERAQRHHLGLPVARQVDALDAPDLESRAEAPCVDGHVEGVLVVVDQLLLQGLVVIALDVDVLRRQQKSARSEKREHEDAQ